MSPSLRNRSSNRGHSQFLPRPAAAFGTPGTSKKSRSRLDCQYWPRPLFSPAISPTDHDGRRLLVQQLIGKVRAVVVDLGPERIRASLGQDSRLEGIVAEALVVVAVRLDRQHIVLVDDQLLVGVEAEQVRPESVIACRRVLVDVQRIARGGIDRLAGLQLAVLRRGCQRSLAPRCLPGPSRRTRGTSWPGS